MIYGSILALIGVGLVVFNGSFVLKLSPVGDLLTLLAALSWAFYSLVIKKMTGRYPTVFITRKIFFLWSIDHTSRLSSSSAATES